MSNRRHGSHSYHRDYGRFPYGELGHGRAYLLPYYMNFFHADHLVTLKLLKLLADDQLPPAMLCPCGSRKALGACHGPSLAELRSHYSPKGFELELREMIAEARREGIGLPERDVLPRKMWQRRRKRLNHRGK